MMKERRKIGGKENDILVATEKPINKPDKLSLD